MYLYFLYVDFAKMMTDSGINNLLLLSDFLREKNLPHQFLVNLPSFCWTWFVDTAYNIKHIFFEIIKYIHILIQTEWNHI
jgi:hypothetical protein